MPLDFGIFYFGPYDKKGEWRNYKGYGQNRQEVLVHAPTPFHELSSK
jgi:hypothetical protein